jgi:acetyl esterase/lipase
MPLRCLIVILLFATTTACHPQTSVPETLRIINDVEYDKVGERALHLKIVMPKIPPAKPMPAVLWVHGGGWEAGRYQDNAAWPLAARDYFTASIEYRLSGEARWPAQIEACKLAIRWLRSNAAKWHVDPDRIGVWGHSAGGHLVACLGTMDERAGFDVGAYTNVSSRVQAVVNYAGPSDFTRGSAGLVGAKEGVDAGILVKLFGGGFKQKPAVWQTASPVTWASSNSAPMLIVHGDTDALVPLEQAEVLNQALKQAGAKVELIVVKNGDHGMQPAKREFPAEPSDQEIHRRVLHFFDDHLVK